jgi:hypothetical protein
MDVELERDATWSACVGSVVLEDGRKVLVRIQDQDWRQLHPDQPILCDDPAMQRGAELAALEPNPYPGEIDTNAKGVLYRRVMIEHLRRAEQG